MIRIKLPEINAMSANESKRWNIEIANRAIDVYLHVLINLRSVKMDNPRDIRARVNVTTHVSETKYFRSHLHIEVFRLQVRGTCSPSFASPFIVTPRTRRHGNADEKRNDAVSFPRTPYTLSRPRSLDKATYKRHARARARARQRERERGKKERGPGATCLMQRANFCSSEINKTESVCVCVCVCPVAQPEDYSAPSLLLSLFLSAPSPSTLRRRSQGRVTGVCVNRRR